MPYLRLRFAAAPEAHLQKLVSDLAQHGLVSQLDDAAKLGRHPFHVTLFAGVHLPPRYSVPPPLAAVAGSLAAIAALPPFSLLASEGVLGAVEGRKVVARFHGSAALRAHSRAVQAVVPGLEGGRAFDPAYGGHKPNLHITLGVLAEGASADALQKRLQRACEALPPLALAAVEFEDDAGGTCVPRGTLALGSAPPQGGAAAAGGGAAGAGAADADAMHLVASDPATGFRLWVGDMASSRDLAALQAAGIACVVNCCTSDLAPSEWAPHAAQGLRYRYVFANDLYNQKGARCWATEGDPTFQLQNPCPQWPGVMEFLLEARAAGSPALIHCAAGRNRSVATAAAFMALSGLATTVDAAVEAIRKARPQVNPSKPTNKAFLGFAKGFVALARASSLSVAGSFQPPTSVTLLHISDTHNLHGSLSGALLPAADILVHTGDYTEHGTESEVSAFNAWLGQQRPRFKAILVINGNHDRPFCKAKLFNATHVLCGEAGAVGEAATVLGLKFYGTQFLASQRGGQPDLDPSPFHAIPQGIDVLLTHCPPQGILDLMEGTAGRYGSSKELLAALYRVRPGAHLFGHLHEQRGAWWREAGAWAGGVDYAPAHMPKAAMVPSPPPPLDLPVQLLCNTALKNHPHWEGGSERLLAGGRLITATLGSSGRWAFSLGAPAGT